VIPVEVSSPPKDNVLFYHGNGDELIAGDKLIAKHFLMAFLHK